MTPRKRTFKPQRESRAVIPIRADGEVRIAVVADTHSRPHPKALELVAAQRPDAILHAGDIGELSVLETFSKLAPLFAVRGNIDAEVPALPDLLDIALTKTQDGEAVAVLNLLLVHIGVYGPKLRADVARVAKHKRVGLVVCGHSHVPFIGRDRGLAVFNPGSIGPRRFSLPIVFGMLELKAGQVSLWHVDCENGERWLP
jgi:putative phosphoesterase